MNKFIFLILNILASLGCFAQSNPYMYAHRGYRAFMPENTVQSMKFALDHKAAVLEMDIAITSDGYAVLSHDPWLDSLITLDPAGKPIKKGKDLAIYKMAYDEIARYDVGSKQHKDFPKQRNFKAVIPKLEDLIDSVEAYANKLGVKPKYSIETKTNKSRDNIAHPTPEIFVQKLMSIIIEKNIEDRVIIQSFDPRTLEIVHRDYPNVVTMLNATKGTFEENMAMLSFLPTYYAPNANLIDAALVEKCNKLGVKLLCGNNNSKKEIDRVRSIGINEFCSDYPYELLPN